MNGSEFRFTPPPNEVTGVHTLQVPDASGEIFLHIYNDLPSPTSNTIACEGKNLEVSESLKLYAVNQDSLPVGDGGEALYFQFGDRFENELKLKQEFLKSSVESIGAYSAWSTLGKCDPGSIYSVSSFTIEAWSIPSLFLPSLTPSYPPLSPNC